MRTYMARLGQFQFGLDTAAFTELQRQSNYRWEGQNRIGRKPAQQFTGFEADTITLNGVIFPHFRGGISQVSQMRAAAAAGEPLPLIYAFDRVGQFCGRWCITSIEEGRTVFFDDGRPRRIEFRISLKEYGEDDGQGLLEAAVGLALSIPTLALSEATAAAVSSANGATGQASALAAAPKVSTAAKATATGMTGAVDTIKGSRTKSILARVAGDLSAIAKAAGRLQTAAALVDAAEGDPIAMADAMIAVGNAADASVGALNRVTGRIDGSRTAYNGGSAGSAFARQATDVGNAMRGISGSAGKISSSATKIRGHL